MKTTKRLFSKAILLPLICICLGCAYLEAALPTITKISPNSGPVWEDSEPISEENQVIITGTHFHSPPIVYFGTKTATVTWISSREIIAIAPAGTTGIVDVTVTTKEGTSATTSATQYTYIESRNLKTNKGSHQIL